MHKVICLMGLTGTGKTALAMALSDAMPCEIVSVDSAMIYQGMDIGSAKPDHQLLEKYPHHLIDVVTPWQTYNAAQFVKDVEQCIEEICAQDRVPILVGGTMMYFKSLQQGLNQLPESQPEVRQMFEQLKSEKGLGALHEKLKQCDPDSAARINENDPQRIIRALEVFELTGKPMSELLKHNAQASTHQFINIGLIPENRARLHALLAERFDQMLAQGFEEEVKHLMQQGLTEAYASMRCVGYKQMLTYLNGLCSFDDMREQAIVATRQLAKRQHTWLRKWPELHVFEPWQDGLLEKTLDVINLSLRK